MLFHNLSSRNPRKKCRAYITIGLIVGILSFVGACLVASALPSHSASLARSLIIAGMVLGLVGTVVGTILLLAGIRI